VAAAAASDVMSSVMSVGTLIGLLLGYGIGYFHALWRRARTDYVATKDSIPMLRRRKWDAWEGMMRRGALTLGIVAALVVWAVAELRG
jgi:hypothetical protein